MKYIIAHFENGDKVTIKTEDPENHNLEQYKEIEIYDERDDFEDGLEDTS